MSQVGYNQILIQANPNNCCYSVQEYTVVNCRHFILHDSKIKPCHLAKNSVQGQKQLLVATGHLNHNNIRVILQKVVFSETTNIKFWKTVK